MIVGRAAASFTVTDRIYPLEVGFDLARGTPFGHDHEHSPSSDKELPEVETGIKFSSSSASFDDPVLG
jgi:hypothetical protein